MKYHLCDNVILYGTVDHKIERLFRWTWSNHMGAEEQRVFSSYSRRGSQRNLKCEKHTMQDSWLWRWRGPLEKEWQQPQGTKSGSQLTASSVLQSARTRFGQYPEWASIQEPSSGDIWLWPCETLSGKLRWAQLDIPNSELINRCCIKLLKKIVVICDGSGRKLT